MPHSIAGASVAVTGGAGFIGSHLVAELIARGAERVVVIDSLRYGDPGNLGSSSQRVQLVKHTLGTDAQAELDAALAGCDFLFHLAAEKHNQSKDDPVRVYRANIEGTHTLYEAAVRAGVKKVVFSSSLYAYGRTSGGPFDETEVPQPNTVYGITKLAGEHMLRYFEKQHGLSYNVLRYLFVYGPKQFAGMGYKSVIVKSFEHLLAGEAPQVYGDGKQELDYVYVDDVVDATIRALTHEASGQVLNVGSGVGTPVAALIAEMTAIAGKTVSPRTAPADWTAGTRRVGAVTRIADVLGWRATTPLSAGLRRVYEFMQQQG